MLCSMNGIIFIHGALPVFGSSISGERCDGGVPGEKCSLLYVMRGVSG